MIVVRGTAVSLLLAALAVACGGSDPGEDNGGSTGGSTSGGSGSTQGGGAGTSGAPAMSRGPLLPWATGNSWTYRVTDDNGAITTKRTTVGPLEPVGGVGPNKDKMANRVTTHKDDTGDGVDLDETVSWQAVEGERLVRYREQSFSRSTKALELEEYWDPHKLHVDSSAEHVTVGVSWLEAYGEHKLPVGGEPIAATPRDRWFVERVESVTVPAGSFEAVVLRKVSAANSMKTYWYVPNVGKVKETGGQTEELTEYQLN